MMQAVQVSEEQRVINWGVWKSFAQNISVDCVVFLFACFFPQSSPTYKDSIAFVIPLLGPLKTSK